MEAAGDPEKFTDEPKLPVPSGLSRKIDVFMENPHDFTKDGADSSVNENPDLAGASCVSMKSEASMDKGYCFTMEDPERDQYDCSEPTDVDGRAVFKLVEEHAVNILRSELKRYEKMLFPHPHKPPSSGSENQEEECLSTADKIDDTASEGVLKITLHVLKEMGQKELANKLEKHIYGELDVASANSDRN
ncbi:hypothetical protein Q5P01_012853 [Channa striata]|uniref:Uncharacterized protein n=1 Tax=Channa striata TaxID=64152 RepID=A0AA88MUH2_CHASR|nr:hypothetical protein Q5P01_012853 [Channa striata]